MITLILLAYLAGVVVAFKVIRIKATPVSIAAAVVIGVFLLGGIISGWKFAAPTSKQMILRRPIIPIVPGLREFVSKVHVESEQFVKAGDPLFEIRPDRYQYALDSATAQQASAEANVSQLEASLASVGAAIKKAEADTAAAQAKFEMASNAQQMNPGAIPALKVEEAKQSYLLAEAEEKRMRATKDQTQASLEAARHAIEVAKAAANVAKFDLELCTYRSQVDGQVLNFQINEGTNVAAWRFTSIGTLMNMGDTAVLAIFPQNILKHVRSGDKVEVAFKRRPGTVVTGVVDTVIKYTGEGQVLPSRVVPTMAALGSKGHLAVRINLDDEALARELPLGASGTVAIYTGFGKPFHLISKITVRMNAWKHYMPF